MTKTKRLIIEGRPVRFGGGMIALKLDNCLFPTYRDLGSDIGQWLCDIMLPDVWATAADEEMGPLVRVTVEVIDDH